MTFGHEFVGVIEQVGPSVRNLEVGDRVMVPFNIVCGTCFHCARGLCSDCHDVNPNAARHGISSRIGRKRADVVHHALDPVILAGRWVAAAYVGVELWRNARG